MLTLGSLMLTRELPYLGVVGNRQDAEINCHGAGLARVVGAEITD
jgi:hypothetical protein